MSDKTRTSKNVKSKNNNDRHALDIVFYVAGLPFNGNTLTQKSLGGSETAGLCMARELSKRGHRVTMFCHYDIDEDHGKHTYDGVNYKEIGENSINFVNYCRHSSADVTIVQRVPDIFAAVTRSKVNCLWQHDLGTRGNIGTFRGILANVDEVFVLSDFHKNQLAEVYELYENSNEKDPTKKRIAERLFYKTRNGIDLYEMDSSIVRHPKRLIYTGRPERGMENIINMIPRLWAVDPDIEIAIAGYDHTVPQMREIYAQWFNALSQLEASNPGKILNLGHLTKNELYKAYQEATAYIYPTDFEDTYCIAMLEAMMCGLPVIATKIAALPETLPADCGILVDNGKDGRGFEGAAGGPEFQERFVSEILTLLKDQSQQDVMRKHGLSYVQDKTWEELADEWDKHFHDLFKERTSSDKTLARHFYRHNDMKALWSMNDANYNKILKKECPQLVSPKAFDRVLADKDKAIELKMNVKASQTPKISIVIPTLDTAKADKVIAHMKNKSCLEHEYIRVDNSETNYGFTKAINTGLELAACDYIAFVNDDIFVESDWDYHLTKLMKEYDIHCISPNYKGEQGFREVLDTQQDTKHNITGSFLLFSRELIEKVGMWDERFFLVFSDIDYELRMNELGYKHHIANNVIAHHLHSQSRISKGIVFDNEWEEKDHYEFEKKYLARPDVLSKHPRRPKAILDKIKSAMFAEPPKTFKDEEYKKLINVKNNQILNGLLPSLCKKDIKNILVVGGDGRDASFLFESLNAKMTVSNFSQKSHSLSEANLKKFTTPDLKEKPTYICGSLGHISSDYDFVWVDDLLANTINPSKWVGELEDKLPDGAFILFSTPINEHKKYKPDGKLKDALWNFEKSDLMDMFNKKDNFNLGVCGTAFSNIDGNTTAWHLVSYTVNKAKKTGKINMARKLAIQAPTQTVTACILTQNSENLLHRTLKSVDKLCDDIVICDASSTDSTLEIAKEYTDKIYTQAQPTKIGFDQARNLSIQHADTDWVLWIDTDEELLTPEKLRKYLRQNSINAYAINQHHFSAMPPNAFKPDLPCRLFRNNAGIEFFGRVHEHPEQGLNKGLGMVMAIDNNESAIAHDGYFTETGRRGRFERNIGLLEWDRIVNPDRDLGKMLEVRDRVHQARYLMEMNGGFRTQQVVDLCHKAIQIFRDECMETTNIDITEGVKYYSAALELLGNQGIEATFALDVHKNGTNKHPGYSTFRFADSKDLKKFFNLQLDAKTRIWETKYL